MSESKATYPWRYLARVAIEFETAFIVGGGRDLFFDDTFVVDANGLPAIPGSTLAGVLRHAWVEAGYSQRGDELFGSQDQGSPLEVSWGCLHNGRNVPVEGIKLNRQTEILDDPVLAEALTMSGRDHVRIDDKGTAADGGKFDESFVSAGHRFTFELQLTAKSEGDPRWQRLLALLAGGCLRIGGKTRRGYGVFKVIAVRQGAFNLNKAEDFAAYVAHPVRLAEPSPLPDILESDDIKTPPASLPKNMERVDLRLQPEGFWMFGGGWGDKADMNPITASRVVWQDGVGSVQEQVALVPASSVKGALAHRTAYHYNLMRKRFAKKEYGDADAHPLVGSDNEAVRALFGYTKGKALDRPGQRGRLLIGDLYLESPPPTKVVNHVSIDRFTAGSRTGLLFSEEPFFGGDGFTLVLLVREREKIEAEAPGALEAFRQALDDLAGGLLPLGGGVNRGNGFFTGTVTWHASAQEKGVANG